MLLRCELAEALRKSIDREGITQAQAAERLGVAQPRISEISRNKVHKLSLDYLVGLCAKAGVAVKVRPRRKSYSPDAGHRLNEPDLSLLADHVSVGPPQKTQA